MGVIKSSQAELKRDGMEMAERFFAERPRDFALLVEKWFEDEARADSDSIAQLLIATHTNGASARKNRAVVRKICRADFGPLAFAASQPK